MKFSNSCLEFQSRIAGNAEMHWFFMLLKSGIFRRCVALLPFTLTGQKPLERAIPEKLVTLGDHLKKRRLDMGLYQKDVAVAIGVDTCTIANWEKGRTQPELRFVPRITEFLGYASPQPHPNTLGEQIKQYRILRGISQKELAKQIGIDPGTLSRLERGWERRQIGVIRRVQTFFEQPQRTL
jgi:transcriptional regulator with XRE-family HTH domain